MRADLETFEVENPKEAMQKFKDALAEVVKVPKSLVKRKRAKAQHKKKRKR